MQVAPITCGCDGNHNVWKVAVGWMANTARQRATRSSVSAMISTCLYIADLDFSDLDCSELRAFPHECELGGDLSGELKLLQIVEAEVRAG